MRGWIPFNKTEVSLWLLFLLFCAGFGYFQGIRPDFKLSEYLLPPVQIQILTISDNFFPPEVISELEQETHTKIQLRNIKSWADLKLRLISEPSPEILFVPAHWAQSLHQEGLLNTEVNFQKIFPNLLASDFNAGSEDAADKNFTSDFLPLYWAKLTLLQTSTPPKSLEFLNDADLFLSYIDELKKTEQDESFLQLQTSIFDLSKWFSSDTSAADLFLTTHVLASLHPEWKRNSAYPDAIYQVGFVLSKNLTHSKKILKIIAHYSSFEVQKPLLDISPFASTLQSVNGSSLPLEKKSFYLRNLKMNQLVLVRPKEKASEEKAKKMTSATFSL